VIGPCLAGESGSLCAAHERWWCQLALIQEQSIGVPPWVRRLMIGSVSKLVSTRIHVSRFAAKIDDD